MAPTSKPFTVAEGRLAGLFVESVILGFYLVTFVHTIRSLIWTGSRWKRLREINHPLLVVALLMFVNVVLGIAMTFHIVWRAFVTESEHSEIIFGDITNWALVMKSSTLLMQTIIGDAMLIYRCWVVYQRSWLVIIASLVLWIGGATCAVFLIYYETVHTTNALISATKFLPFGIAFWALTVAVNIITTSLLVWPIWKAARRHDQFAYQSVSSSYNNTMKDVMYVIIESGFMYTVAAFITFVTYTTKHNSLYIVSNAEVGIAGIAFNLIIVRTDKVRRAKAPPTIGASIHFSSRFARRSTLQADNVHSTMSPSTTNEEVHDEHGTTATASTSRALETKINIDDNVP